MAINEFLPNPVGKDTDNEWIELFNNGNTATNIDGWQIKDVSGRIFYLKGAVEPNEYLVLDYKTTKISLNNDGETLFLYDQNGRLIDKVEYSGKAPEGKSLARQGDKFIFTGQPTPGKENIFPTSKSAPINAEETAVSLAPNNYSAPINQNINHEFIFAGFGISLFLSFASVLIIKKMNLFNGI